MIWRIHMLISTGAPASVGPGNKKCKKFHAYVLGDSSYQSHTKNATLSPFYFSTRTFRFRCLLSGSCPEILAWIIISHPKPITSGDWTSLIGRRCEKRLF
eukprot:g52891.t1